MSQSPRIKGGTTDVEFQKRWLLWATGASVGVDFDLFKFVKFFEKHKNIDRKEKTIKA